MRPADFVEARGREAARLRADGDAATARAVTGLRRPGVAAGLVNAVVRERADLVDELRDVGRRLRAASVGGDADDVRSADRERRATIRRCVTAADDLARGQGAAASASTLRDVEQTFWAALVDPGAFAAVTGGALLTPLAPNGFGAVDVAAASAVPVVVEDDAPVAARAQPRREPRRTRVAADAVDAPDEEEDDVDEAALVAARDRVEAAERDLAEAEHAAATAADEATSAGARTAGLKDELAAVRRRLTEVEGELRDASADERRTSADLKNAERARRAADDALERARRAVRALDP